MLYLHKEPAEVPVIQIRIKLKQIIDVKEKKINTFCKGLKFFQRKNEKIILYRITKKYVASSNQHGVSI